MSEPKFETEPQFIFDRIVSPNDLDALIDKSASYGELNFSFPENYLVKLKAFVNDKGVHVIAKNFGDRSFAGYVGATENSLAAFPNTLLIVELFVDPKEQGKGLGRKLVQLVIDIAKTHGLRGAVVQTENENVPAQALYEKFGFKKVANPDWNEGVTYLMEF